MHDPAPATERRLRRVLETRLRPATVTERIVCAVAAFSTPDRRLGFSRAVSGPYQPLARGDAWGAPFSTSWMVIDAHVPEAWRDGRVELRVDLGFDPAAPGFQAEALAFDVAGAPLKGVAPRNAAIPLDRPGPLRVYLEAAANPTITAAHPQSALLGDPTTASPAPLYQFKGAEIVLVDPEAEALCHDLDVLGGLAAALGTDDPWRHELLAVLTAALEAIDPASPAAGARRARALLVPAFRRRGDARAPVAFATGHAHIDTAWLWPLEETRRKVARTIASVTALADAHRDFVFVFSQAQQWEWVKDDLPELFARLRTAVERDQVVPVGGMWVEADTNLPGGEALARHLLYGQRFFAEHCGAPCTEAWLPDCFGYSAALPQLFAHAGMSCFVTQKLSWNDTNRFPYHTFSWEGIDGTRVVTHFPPVDTYNAEITPGELVRGARNFPAQGPARHSLVPFGYGDGGGGPTSEMLERARRLHDLPGAPRVALASPAAFFAAVNAESATLPVWVGELYLERHRGTLTSQARLKSLNRRVEALLREAELWSTTAAVRGVAPYPYDDLERCWKTLLVRQFHDILPGSAIAMVNDEAKAALTTLVDHLEEQIARTLAALVGPGERALAANPRPHGTDDLPALGVGDAPTTPSATVQATPRAEGGFHLENGSCALEIDAHGLVVSLRDNVAGREIVPPGGSLGILQLHPDLPAEWDAWDIDAPSVEAFEELGSPDALALEVDDGRVAVRATRRFRSSAVEVVYSLRAAERRVVIDVLVEWHEVEHLLKLALPVDLHTSTERAEIQFGHLERPIHTNTTWDAARFERSAQRFVHLAEANYAIALTNTASYGHDTTRHTREGGGTTTTLRWSLVRGARFPDPRAEAGTHEFSFSLHLGVDLAGSVAAGYADNLPLRPLHGRDRVAPLVALDDPAVVVEALKCAEDRSGDIIVRVYESLGGRARATLRCGCALAGAWRTDLLENPNVALALASDARAIALEMRPFEIATLRLRPR